MSSRKSELVALIDMDGTLCDYDGAMRRDMARIAAPGDSTELYRLGEPPHMRERRKLIQDQPGWWRNLEPLPLGMTIASGLSDLGFRLMVLTKGPMKRNPAAWGEKVEWCRQHLPDVPITVTTDKGLTYGKILVDDWPEYVERWLEWRPRGLVLMPAHPWNEEFEHPNVMRCTPENLSEALQRAKDLIGATGQ